MQIDELLCRPFVELEILLQRRYFTSHRVELVRDVVQLCFVVVPLLFQGGALVENAADGLLDGVETVGDFTSDAVDEGSLAQKNNGWPQF